MEPKLQIVYLDPHELKPYERNARKHEAVDIEQIKESIRLDGFNDPIGIWKDNLIVEGHGRQLAAIELGMDKVPCIRLDHLTDTQRRDYALRHNRTAELSEWDALSLKMEKEALELEGVDFSVLFNELEEEQDSYVDDFFDRGVEAKQKTETLGVKVICGTQEQVDDVMHILQEAGYNPEQL